jgi:molybdopterin-binding protein
VKTASYLFAAVTALAAIVLICSAHAGYWGLKLNPQIDAVAVATLAFTIVIAILVQYYFATRMTNRRAEKDLLLENGRDAIAVLKACREALDTSTEHGKPGSGRKQVLLQFRRLSNALDMLETALEMSECKTLAKAAIREEYLSYKAAATRAAPDKPYTVGDLADQERAYHKIRKLLQSLLFQINAHE